ncbi:MAG TPA: hypothetical protein VH394_08380 [Thermoanaerobaculia bacterium]|jgi:hypothetical protein|nr:hypothetical protein [Thermoanaerobaculia bacterium]
MKALLRNLTLAALLCVPAAHAVEDYTSIRIEPEHPTPNDPIHITVTLGSYGDPDLRLAGIHGNRIQIQYDTYAFPDIPPPYEKWTYETTAGPLSAGIYSIEVQEGEAPGYTRTFEVAGPDPELKLLAADQSVFTVTVDFERPGSDQRSTAYGVPLTRQSGYFWFFNPDNAEVTIKILDGRAVNGKYWIFLASMTDLQFTARVTQCPANPEIGAPCVSREYSSQPHANGNIIDVNFQGL